MSRLDPTRWKRFSLRTLLVLMTGCCVLLGVWSMYVDPYRMQANSLAVVRSVGGEYTAVPATGSRPHRWLVTTLLGKDAFVHVTTVDLGGREVDGGVLRSLAGLAHLQELDLDYTEIADEGAAALSAMQDLRRLSLRYTQVSDPTAVRLAALANLEAVYLTGTRVSDEAVSSFADHRGLAELYIRWTRITNAGADQLAAALPRCAVHHHALVDDVQ